MFKKYCGLPNLLIDSVLNMGRNVQLDKICAPAEGIAAALCNLLLYVVGILFFLRSLLYAIKLETMDVIWMGLGVLVGCVLMVYISDKILSTTRGLYSKTLCKLRSSAILDCIALLFVLLGIGAVVMVCKLGMGFSGILAGILVLILCLLVAATAICPSILSIELDENCSAGEEFIGLLTFFLKNLLFLLPFVIFAGNAALIWFLLFELGIGEEYAFLMMTSIPVIIGIGLLPLSVYLIYLVYYFILDICRAILTIPAKLDKLNK